MDSPLFTVTSHPLPLKGYSLYTFYSLNYFLLVPFFCNHQKKGTERKLTALGNFLKNREHTKKSGASVFGLRCENLSLIRIFLNVCSCFSSRKFPNAVFRPSGFLRGPTR